MVRRRFQLRLHHQDSVLMLLAVLLASSLCWVVLSFSRRDVVPATAYVINGEGLILSPQAAGELIRRQAKQTGSAEVTAITDGQSLRIGIRPLIDDANHQAAAKRLADQLAAELRSTNWRQEDPHLTGEIAKQLAQLRIEIDEVSAARRRLGKQPTQAQRAATAATLTALLERQAELAAMQSTALAGRPPAVQVKRSKQTSTATSQLQANLAVVLFVITLAAVICRIVIGRRARTHEACNQHGMNSQVVRPLADLRFNELRDAVERAAKRAANGKRRSPKNNADTAA